MASWEEIANEIAPANAPARGLATGARRGPTRPYPAAEAQPHPASLVPHFSIAPRVIGVPPFAPGASFDEVLRGAPAQNHYLVAHPATAYDAAFDTFAPRLRRVLENAQIPALSGARLDDLLFVDIETTGLSSDVPLFLIGALHFRENAAWLELFLARHFDEERAILLAFHERARGKTLVTFNGKSFDWPYLRGRSIRRGVHYQEPPAHLDLLHFARRAWKHRLPNCRLQTLELHLCNRARQGDIASARIPERYHEFLEAQRAARHAAPLLAPVLHHNALDVLTLAELLCLAGGDSNIP